MRSESFRSNRQWHVASNSRALGCLTLFVLVLLSAAEVRAQTITVFDPPLSRSTNPSSINAEGQIAGNCGDAFTGTTRGFLRDRNGTITPFNPPNAGFTQVAAISDSGQVIGSFSDTSTGTFRGFLRSPDGTITVFDAPNAESTIPLSINAAGQIAGRLREISPGLRRGFVRDRNGTFTVFDGPDSTEETRAFGISAGGQITGDFVDPITARRRGYVRDRRGATTAFDAPNSSTTIGLRINAAGTVLGQFTDTLLGVRGFLRDRRGPITVFHAPNARRTFPRSLSGIRRLQPRINNLHRGWLVVVDSCFEGANSRQAPRISDAAGEIAGHFFEVGTGNRRGFVRDRRGVFEVFDAPNSTSTSPRGINQAGLVTGSFLDESIPGIPGVRRGFVRVP